MIGSNVPVSAPASQAGPPPGKMDPRKMQMAMMLMGQQMEQMGPQGQSMPGMAPGMALDIYGQPV